MSYYHSFHLNEKNKKYLTVFESFNRELNVRIDFTTVLTVNSKTNTVNFNQNYLLKNVPLEQLECFVSSLNKIHPVWKKILKEDISWQKYIAQIPHLKYIAQNANKFGNVQYDKDGLIKKVELKDQSFLNASDFPQELKMKILPQEIIEGYKDYDKDGFREIKNSKGLLFETRKPNFNWLVYDKTKKILLLELSSSKVLFRKGDYTFSEEELKALKFFATAEQLKEIIETNYKITKIVEPGTNNVLLKYEDSEGKLIKDRFVDSDGKYTFSSRSASGCDYIKNQLYWKTPEGENIVVLDLQTKAIIEINDVSKLTDKLIESVAEYSKSAAIELEKRKNQPKVIREDFSDYYNLITHLSDGVKIERRFDLKTDKPYWNEKFSSETISKEGNVKRIWKNPEGKVLVTCSNQDSITIESKEVLSDKLINSIRQWHYGIPNLDKIIKEHNDKHMVKVERIQISDIGAYIVKSSTNGVLLKEEVFDSVKNQPYFNGALCSVFRKEGDSRIFEWKDKEGNLLCSCVDGIVTFKTEEASEELLKSVGAVVGPGAKAVDSMRAKMEQKNRRFEHTKSFAPDKKTIVYSMTQSAMGHGFFYTEFLEKFKIEKKDLVLKFPDDSAFCWDSKGQKNTIDNFKQVYKIVDNVAYLQPGVDWKKTVNYANFVPFEYPNSVFTKTKFGYSANHELINCQENFDKLGEYYFDEETFSRKHINSKGETIFAWLKAGKDPILATLKNKELVFVGNPTNEQKVIIEKCALKHGYIPKEENKRKIVERSSFVDSVGQRILTRKLTKIIQGALITQLTKSIGNKKVREETQESISNFFKSEMGKGFLGLAIGSVVSMLSDVEILKDKKDLITSLSDELQVEGMAVLGEESLDFIVEKTLPLFSSFFKETETNEELTKVRVVNEMENNVTVNINFQHEIEQGLKIINATSKITNET